MKRLYFVGCEDEWRLWHFSKANSRLFVFSLSIRLAATACVCTHVNESKHNGNAHWKTLSIGFMYRIKLFPNIASFMIILILRFILLSLDNRNWKSFFFPPSHFSKQKGVEFKDWNNYFTDKKATSNFPVCDWN